MEFSGYTDELIAMLPRHEHSCQGQLFVMVFFMFFLYS